MKSICRLALLLLLPCCLCCSEGRRISLDARPPDSGQTVTTNQSLSKGVAYYLEAHSGIFTLEKYSFEEKRHIQIKDFPTSVSGDFWISNDQHYIAGWRANSDELFVYDQQKHKTSFFPIPIRFSIRFAGPNMLLPSPNHKRLLRISLLDDSITSVSATSFGFNTVGPPRSRWEWNNNGPLANDRIEYYLSYSLENKDFQPDGILVFDPKTNRFQIRAIEEDDYSAMDYGFPHRIGFFKHKIKINLWKNEPIILSEGKDREVGCWPSASHAGLPILYQRAYQGRKYDCFFIYNSGAKKAEWLASANYGAIDAIYYFEDSEIGQ